MKFELKNSSFNHDCFLKIALIAKRLELPMPDWSQIKYNLKMFTSDINLAPVIKPFEIYRKNIEKWC